LARIIKADIAFIFFLLVKQSNAVAQRTKSASEWHNWDAQRTIAGKQKIFKR